MLYQRGVMGRSPFEKGETGGFECDFDAGMVWTYSTNFSDTTLADAGRILGFAGKPAAEAVVGFQITDLPLVGHGIL